MTGTRIRRLEARRDRLERKVAAGHTNLTRALANASAALREAKRSAPLAAWQLSNEQIESTPLGGGKGCR
jgi:Mg-chelatase subunit ChlD